MTFEADTYDRDEIERGMKRLSDEVAMEVNKAGFVFRNVTIKLRYSDFSEKLKGRAVKPSSSADEIYETAIKLYLANAEKGRKLRKIGVRVSGLMKYGKQSRLG